MRTAILAVLGCASVAGAQCASMQPVFGTSINGPVEAVTSWNSGGGNRVVIGGDFHGAAFHDYIAWWDGAAWNDFGWGFDAPAHALTTWSPGGVAPAQVIAGGSFLTAGADSTGAISASHIASWDGSAWHALGGGLSDNVSALISWDPDGDGPLPPRLVAAGDFHGMHDYIAWWDGTSWHDLGWGFDGPVRALALWDPDGPGPLPPQLVAGGEFINAGADSTGQVTVNHVAVWDGAAWRALGDGVANNVRTLAVFAAPTAGDPDRVAAVGEGAFQYWNGLSWGIPFELLRQDIGDLSTIYSSAAAFDIGESASSSPRLAVNGHTDYSWCLYHEGGPPGCDWIYWSYDPTFSFDNAWNKTPVTAPPWAQLATVTGDGGLRRLIGMSGSAPYLYQYMPAAALTLAPLTGASARLGGNVTVSASSNFSGATFYWECKASDGSYSTLYDSTGTFGTSLISGASTNTLTISHLGAHDPPDLDPQGPYELIGVRCTATAPCQSVTSGTVYIQVSRCSADVNKDGDSGTDADIEAFFACIAGNCCPACDGPDFNGDGDIATDADIESFFRVLAGGAC
jgi:hypothetical protein